VPLVYRAANVVDAQLVVDELRAGGMQARVTGTYLSGAIGELPPTEVIGVWLEQEQHMQRAREVIEDYEASQRRNASDWYCSGCREEVGGEFGACWNCGKVRVV